MAEIALAEDFVIVDCGKFPADPSDTVRTGQNLYLTLLGLILGIAGIWLSIAPRVADVISDEAYQDELSAAIDREYEGIVHFLSEDFKDNWTSPEDMDLSPVWNYCSEYASYAINHTDITLLQNECNRHLSYASCIKLCRYVLLRILTNRTRKQVVRSN